MGYKTYEKKKHFMNSEATTMHMLKYILNYVNTLPPVTMSLYLNEYLNQSISFDFVMVTQYNNQ